MNFAILVGAILAANLLTALFGWGMFHAFRIKAHDPAPPGVFFAILAPAMAMGAAGYLALNQ